MAYVEIVEQPAAKSLKFRYEAEGRTAGSIRGAYSTAENRTFPTIQVRGYQGPAVVIVSCVTKNPPYRAHPHKLVGRNGCKNGLCVMPIPEKTMRVSFPNVGVQRVKRKDVEKALSVRRKLNIDPFNRGFGHMSQPSSIDLKAVRLCFQVILMTGSDGNTRIHLDPVVSEPIYDKASSRDLAIVKMSNTSCFANGGDKEIILVCKKVNKDDIQIRFFQERDDQCVWEEFADFSPSQVMEHTTILFRPPRFHDPNIKEPVHVSVQLFRPSDSATSNSEVFTYLPMPKPTIPPKKEKPVTKKAEVQNESCRRFQNSPPNYYLGGFLNVVVQEDSLSPYGGEVVLACDTNNLDSPGSPFSDSEYFPLANIPTVVSEEDWNIRPPPAEDPVTPTSTPQDSPPVFSVTAQNGGIPTNLSGLSDVSLNINIMDLGPQSVLNILNSKDLMDLDMDQLSETILSMFLE